MANGILVFCETEGGAVKKTAHELLGKATQLGGPVSAVVIGDGRRVDSTWRCTCGGQLAEAGAQDKGPVQHSIPCRGAGQV